MKYGYDYEWGQLHRLKLFMITWERSKNLRDKKDCYYPKGGVCYVPDIADF